jgi:hypothetical protein
MAVSPENDLYLYREYYKSNLTVSENCRNIISASGNEVKDDGLTNDVRSGMVLMRMSEVPIKERYRATIMDKRSMNSSDPLTQMTLGKLYGYGGLRVSAASGSKAVDVIPIVKQFMEVDLSKQHPRNDIVGAPRLLVFRNLVNFRREREGYAFIEYKSSKAADQGNPYEKPKEKDNHLMDCLMYLVQIPPRYIEGRWGFYTSWIDWEEDDEDKKTTKFIRDKYTGY